MRASSESGGNALLQFSQVGLSSSMQLCVAALGDKFQRYAIIAPALAGGLRAIIEDVTVMTAAADAVIFGAGENKFVVRARTEHAWNRRKKAWPTCAALIFHLGGKQRQVASETDEDTGTLFGV
jgi:hypothetical protein